MAEGYARATGKPGVVVVTSGPGATNMVTPMQDALMDGTPMVVFTGQVPVAAMGTDAFQEADVVGITRSCTKWNVLVKDIRDLPRRINEAFHIATSGRPGPVLVDLPKDVTAGKLMSVPDSAPRMASRQFQKSQGDPVTDEQLDKVARMINSAKRPVLYAGQGVLHTAAGPAVLRQIAKSGNIPCTTTMQGLGAFDEMDPLSLHMLGMHGSAYANYAMQSADVIVALGARFDDRVTGNLAKFAPEALRAEREGRGGIVHFEISPKQVNKVVRPTIAVMGDVAENMARLLPMVKHAERREWLESIAGWKQKHPFAYTPASGAGKLKPQQVLEALQRQLSTHKEVVISTGVGQHQMWAAQYLRWRQPRSWVSSGGSGTMGFGLPAAIGAKLGRPNATVVDIDGDASFSMTGMELMTAAQYKIGVKVLILNNDFQGMVKQWQDLFYKERYSGTPMINPDFKLLAESMGVKGIDVTSADHLEARMKEFLEHDGPVLMNAKVEKDEHVFPMVPAGRGLDEMVLGMPPK